MKKFMFAAIAAALLSGCNYYTDYYVELPQTRTTDTVYIEVGAEKEEEVAPSADSVQWNNYSERRYQTCVVIDKVFKYDEHYIVGECIDNGNVCRYVKIGEHLLIPYEFYKTNEGYDDVIPIDDYDNIQIGDTLYAHWMKGII